MASFSKEDGRSIVDLLECPVCLTTMKPPMYQCRSGHSVCGECKERVKHCPTCRGAFIDTRNRIAEELANKVRYPCKNTFHGCNEKAYLKDMEKHESVCPHRMYHCLVAKDNGCTWTGKRSDLLRHTKKKHDKNIVRRQLCKLKHNKLNFFQRYTYSKIFLLRGEIFWLRSDLDPLKRKLYEAVQYIGPAENASKYAYEHRFVSPSGDKKFTYVNAVKSDTADLMNIQELQKCFVMDYDTLKLFAQNGKDLNYTVKVCKQD
jgi:E3 ubiquitin-protein ligase SIAH1